MINMRDLLLGATMRAAHVHRYSAIPVNHKESIAEHSFFVAIYADRLAVDLNFMDELPHIIKSALWHDIEETWTGDFIRSFKYSDSELKTLMDVAAQQCAYRVFHEILQNRSHADLALKMWDEAKTHSNVGRVVKFADFLSVVSYIAKEAAMGNEYAKMMLRDGLPDYLRLFQDNAYADFRGYVFQIEEILMGGWKNVRACI